MDLKAKELVEIINACGKNGVSHIKIGEIDMKFNGFVIHTETDYPKNVAKISDSHVPVDPNFDHQVNFENAEEEMESLMVTDPAAYEEALFALQLDDSDSNMDSEQDDDIS
jgi:hypothetical protein